MSFENLVRILQGENAAVIQEVEASLVANVTESRVYNKGVLLLKV